MKITIDLEKLEQAIGQCDCPAHRGTSTRERMLALLKGMALRLNEEVIEEVYDMAEIEALEILMGRVIAAVEAK